MKVVLEFDSNDIVELLYCLRKILRKLHAIDIFRKCGDKHITKILSMKNMIRYERYEKYYMLFYDGYSTMLDSRTARKILNLYNNPGLVPINTNNVINVNYLQCFDDGKVYLKLSQKELVPSKAGRHRLEKYLEL